MNDRTNQIIGGVVVIILIIGAWYAGKTQMIGGLDKDADTADMVDETDDSDADTGSDAASTETRSVTASGESVTVTDQSAGSIVKVVSVTLPELGWIAVRDNNGRVLGARRFEAGTSEDVEVVLLRNTVAGEKYQVLLYIDDGDMEYDLHKDSLVMNADASVAGTTFNAQ